MVGLFLVRMGPGLQLVGLHFIRAVQRVKAQERTYYGYSMGEVLRVSISPARIVIVQF